ncbi:MAG: alanine racemase C-terminal domain-containing protein [Gammaproteobacteria bacterium]
MTRVRELAPGSRVGHGAVPMRRARPKIATLAIGYADGLRRSPRPWPGVLIAGVLAPILEPVCMDPTIVDVSDCPPVRVGDAATFIGDQGDLSLSVVSVATAIGTIPEEALSALGRRLELGSDPSPECGTG